MRKSFPIVFILLFVIALSAFAIPAKRGIWQTIKLNGGTEVRVELRGDEHFHWWQAEDGVRYVADSLGNYRVLDNGNIVSAAKRRAVAAKRQNKIMRRANADNSLFKGEKKGLIILVDFPNKKFSIDNSAALYNRIANEQDYSDHGFNGSIRDYFIAQSGGQFTLDFDVVGPVTMSHNYSYYGNNNEANAPEMIKEACRGVDGSVDFSRYDWDGDGEVEEVFVLYAGHGQADYDSNNDNLIWPHMFWINADGYPENDFYLDNVKIDVYACSSELNGSGNIAGIGTFCHEFSHCMGFPDIYDTSQKPTNFGMGAWDLMDYGSYNGDGYTPSGYTGYERMECGWTNPIELTNDTTITGIRPLIDMGQSYIVYNQGNRNEYYILTNRQQHGYDADIPGHGMLIEHIDYDQTLWDGNVVNTTDNTDYPNDHQRITIFHASSIASGNGTIGDAYPYHGNDSLTSNSIPAATVYNANNDGNYYMNCAIRDITENSDGTMSFSFGKSAAIDDSGKTDTTTIPKDGILFRETFDKCNGSGGNDGSFSGSVASGEFNPDNKGWEGYNNSYVYGGDKCARFGNSNNPGYVLTPEFTLPGDTVFVSFRAAAWNAKKEGTNLRVTVSANGRLLDDGDVTLTKGKFSSYTLRLLGKGTVRLAFLGNKRFFLDDVLVVYDKATKTGISSVTTTANDKVRIYTINGQYVGKDINSLPKGIYIMNGRKVVR